MFNNQKEHILCIDFLFFAPKKKDTVSQLHRSKSKLKVGTCQFFVVPHDLGEDGVVLVLLGQFCKPQKLQLTIQLEKLLVGLINKC